MSFVSDLIREAFSQAEDLNTADWIKENFYTQDGRAFSEQAVPWVTAPQGPCWAMDSIQFRVIWLQWAARMFKTNFGLASLQRRMDQRPGEFMFATPDETNCKAVFSRLWKMIEHCPVIRDQAPRRHRQAKTVVRLRRSIVYGAWPRGKSRLADKSIPFGHGNEIDKWEQESTSTEGDPLPRFLKRGAEYPDRKFVLESTPSQKGKSRVEAGRLRSTNHGYHVPCPHCGKFQRIVFGDGENPGGIFWEKLNGATDRDHARRTAHYVCAHCEGRIDDMHRPEMMGLGVWVPAGCEVDHDRAIQARELPPDDMSWLRGEPLNWGSEYGSQISVFYALFHGWGDCVYDFLGKRDRPQDFRQWVNEDKGETWEIVRRKAKWQDIAERAITSTPRRVVPADCDSVTIGVDKQEGFYPFVVTAWTAKGQSPHVIDYGLCESTEELQRLALTKWEREGGGFIKSPAMLVDSGYRPHEVFRLIDDLGKTYKGIRACRGSYGARLPGYYTNRQNGPRSANPGRYVTWVDTHSTQDWADNEIHDGGLTVFRGSLAEHQSFFEQLLNDALVSSLDSNNHERETWQRINAIIPNDFRDCLRYAFVGRLLSAHSDRTGKRGTAAAKASKRDKQRGPVFLDRPGGWVKGIR